LVEKGKNKAMDLEQALKWADDNSQPEVVDRLRSRKVASILASEVRRLQQVWQPIETAPKEWGITVLLWDKKHGASAGSWWLEEFGWIRTPGCAKLKPTHWMPLPEAPNA
jgi:hypothetical protein